MAYVLESLPGAQQQGKFVLESLPDDSPAGGFLDDLARVPGRTLRAAAKGVAGVVSPFSNPLAALWNATAGRIGAPQMNTDAVSGMDALLTRAGVSRPRPGAEEGFDAVGQALFGGGGTIAAAQRVPGTVAAALSAAPGMQAASTAAGSGAGEIARQSDASPLTQTLAALAAGSAPSLAAASGVGLTRSLLRGVGDDKAARFNLNRLDWERTGIDPSVGQVAGTRVAQGVESTLSRTPGGAGVMSRFAQRGAEQMQQRIEQIADDHFGGANATQAGMQIEKGVKGFVQRFKDEQKFLYDKLDALIPTNTNVGVPNTRKALEDLNADIPGAPELSKWFKNAKIQGIERAVDKDAAAVPPQNIISRILSPSGEPFVIGQTPGRAEGVPYEALKKLRTLVGRELESNSLVADVPRSKWKALYAALSEDMNVAAKTAGPQAERAFDRANWFSRAGYDRIESVLDRVSGKDTAEKIFQAAVNPSEVREGATTINAVMRSLAPEERKAVSSAVVRRLGQATAGKQDDVGSVFSSETFLTNWNKIGPEAKRVLFANDDARRGLDGLALAASRIREGSKVFANPSGTSGGVASIGAALGSVQALATGNMPMLASILAGIGGSYGSARLLTNQRFVEWVGKTTKMPAALLPAQLTMLQQASKKWPDQDRRAADEFIDAATKASQQQQQQ